MQISRRRALLAAGLATTAIIPFFSRRAQSEGECSSVPFVITVHAGGGWDPTYFCDPVADDERFTPWKGDEIMEAGPIKYAPFRNENGIEAYAVNDQDFFKKHVGRLTVINGVDNATVSHGVGGRYAHTGTAREGLPTLSALVAGLAGPTLPMAFMASNNAATRNLVPLTRVSGGARELQQILDPNVLKQWKDNVSRYFTPDIYASLQQHSWERDQRRIANPKSARELASLKQIAKARNAGIDETFLQFQQALDGFEQPDTSKFADAVSVVLLAMKSGSCASAHLSVDGAGFDTHADHNSLSPYGQSHRLSLLRLVQGLDYLVDTVLAEPRLKERGVIVHVASEFGRTAFNDGSGKDHWPITSNMVLGVGAAEKLVGGNRVVGATSPTGGEKDGGGVRARLVKERDGKLVIAEDEDPDAFRLSPALIHVALRKAIGLCDDDHPDRPLTRFKVPLTSSDPIPLFS